MATKYDKAAKDAAAGATAGSVFGPWGTVAGGALGGAWGFLSGDDASAPPPPKPVEAPTLDPNAGIGTGYGGLTPEEQARISAAQADYDKNQGQLYKNYQDAEAQFQQAFAASGGNPNDPNVQGLHARVMAAREAYQRPSKFTPGMVVDLSDPGRFAAQAGMSYNRAAPQATMVAPDRSQIQLDQATQAGARNDLNAGIGSMQSLAGRLNSDLAGNAPSLAQAQLNQTTQQNIAAQRSMAASAGPMDYAAAQRAAIMSGANVQQQAVGQAAMLRAQEYAAAEGLLGQTTQNIANAQVAKRAQDLQNLGYSYHDSIARAQFEAQQGQFNAGMQAQQNALNQGREMGYLNAYQGARSLQQQNAIAQLNARVSTNGQNMGAGAANYATQSSNFNQANQAADQNRRDVLNMISSGVAAYKTSNSNPQAPTLQDDQYSTPAARNPDWGDNQNGWT